LINKHFPFNLGFKDLCAYNIDFFIHNLHKKFGAIKYYKITVEKTENSFSIFANNKDLLFKVFSDEQLLFVESSTAHSIYLAEYTKYKKEKKPTCINTLIKTNYLQEFTLMYSFVFRNIFERKLYADGYYYIKQSPHVFVPDANQMLLLIANYHTAFGSIASHFSYSNASCRLFNKTNTDINKYQENFLELIPDKYKKKYKEALCLSFYLYETASIPDYLTYLGYVHQFTKLKQFKMIKISKSE